MIGIFVFLTLCGGSTLFAQTRPALLESPTVQVELEALCRTTPRDIEFYRHILVLKQMSRTLGFEAIVEQAALCSIRRGDNWRTGDLRPLSSIVWQLNAASDGSVERRVAMALLPYLEADDAKLRSFVEVYIGTYTPLREETLLNPAMAATIAFIQLRRADPPWRAVQIAYWRAPSAMMLELGQKWSDGDPKSLRELRWSEHVIADAVWKEPDFLTPQDAQAATTELEELSRHPGWWVRLYAAEMLRRHEMFRRQDVLERLRQDQNPLVAAAADVPYFGGMSEQEYKQWKKEFPGLKAR